MVSRKGKKLFTKHNPYPDFYRAEAGITVRPAPSASPALFCRSGDALSFLRHKSIIFVRKTIEISIKRNDNA